MLQIWASVSQKLLGAASRQKLAENALLEVRMLQGRLLQPEDHILCGHHSFVAVAICPHCQSACTTTMQLTSRNSTYKEMQVQRSTSSKHCIYAIGQIGGWARGSLSSKSKNGDDTRWSCRWFWSLSSKQGQSKAAPDSFSLAPTTHITGVFAFSAFLIILAIRSPAACRSPSMQTANRTRLRPPI